MVKLASISVCIASVLAAAACSPRAAPLGNFVSVEAPVIALTNVRVIDGTGSPGRSRQTVVIRNGAIAEVGDGSSVAPPAGAKVIDLPGRTVLPGYVMAHEHLFFTPDGNGYTDVPVTFSRLYLAGGATTIRTAGSIGLSTELKLRESIERREVPGPKMELTSPYLHGSKWLLPGQTHESRGRALAAKWADAGATSFKAYEHISREELAGLIAGAHERGLKVTGHLCAVTFGEAADLGIDSLEHGIWVASDFVANKQPDICPDSNTVLEGMLRAEQWAIDKLIGKLVSRRVGITSTLPVFEGFLGTREPAAPAVQDLFAPKVRQRYLAKRAELATQNVPVWGTLLRKEMAFELAFAKAGGLLAVGSDPTGAGGNVAGFSNQRAVELLVEAGFTPIEAIKVATLNGARLLGRDKEVGSIEKGKRADLIVVRGDPEDTITDIKKVETVFKDGIGYDSATIIESVRGIVGTQ